MNGNDPLTLTVNAPDAAATGALAAAFAHLCRSGDCLLLRGDLGAGKTTFARGFIRALYEGEDEIVSPTFTLVQTYLAKDGGTVWHFDLYRLKNKEEIREVGLEDALLSGITLVEWPERAEGEWPEAALDVAIAMGNNPQERIITLTGPRAHWADRLKKLKDTA